LEIKVAALVLGLFIGFFLLLSGNGLKKLFWIGLFLTFVRELSLPFLDTFNFSATIFGFIFFNTIFKIGVWQAMGRIFPFFWPVLLLGSFVAALNKVPPLDIWEWVSPIITVYWVTWAIIYFVRDRADLERLKRIFMWVALIFSLSAVVAALGFYDGTILFNNTAYDVNFNSSRIIGIAYTNLAFGVAALSLFFLPSLRFNQSYKIIYLMLIVIGVFLSFKRLAILALLISFAYFLYAEKRQGGKVRYLIYLGGLLALVALPSFFQAIFERFIIAYEVVTNADSGADSSTLVRLDRIEVAWGAFLSSPLTGIGAGNLIYVHNALLEILANLGLFGLVLINPFWRVLRWGRRKILENPWAAALLTYFATLFLLEATLNRIDIMYFWGFLLGGAIVHQNLQTPD
jgi:O-antigen ligase